MHAVKEGEFVAFDKDYSRPKRLVKLKIPAKYFSDLRRELDRCGINEGSVFPDLDGLAAHIQWYHSELSDEEGE